MYTLFALAIRNMYHSAASHIQLLVLVGLSNMPASCRSLARYGRAWHAFYVKVQETRTPSSNLYWTR